MKDFPKQLFGFWENEGDGEHEFLSTQESIEDTAEVGARRRVAVYELKEVSLVETQIHVSKYPTPTD